MASFLTPDPDARYAKAMLSPEIIALLIGGATLLFGAERLPKLARSAGEARKQFIMAQAEAEELKR